MPINIPKLMPVRKVLEAEHIFLMDDEMVYRQSTRPLTILILNLMPIKETAEIQLLRLLGNTALQIDVTFLTTESYTSQNTSKLHLDKFYKGFSNVKERKFDGMIITGAPVELMQFEQVNYWPELAEIMEWSKTHIKSTLHICWGAQAALYYHFGIGKNELPRKCFGVYTHIVHERKEKLVLGFDDLFLAPHSRYTDVHADEIQRHPKLKLLSSSTDAGALIIASNDGKQIMITGHLEYDADSLSQEYERDLKKGLEIKLPENYYPENNPALMPQNSWRSHGFLLFSNWLNYYVNPQSLKACETKVSHE
ncbi:MAG: homoserine O-succinyltransferase [Bacillota bacterium]|nr:homoserine O-succinyltransferase [Bacillota bacterium]